MSEPLNRKILIVDDEKHIKEVLSELFSFDGHETIVANSGKEALEILRNNSCGLLITDLNMPDMDGIELVRTIRDLNISLLIIGMSSEEKEYEFLRAGANCFLLKPFDMHYLKFLVNVLLGE